MESAIGEVTASVQKVKRRPGVITVYGNSCGSITRKQAKARCPNCRKKIRFSETDVRELWKLYDEWNKEDAYLQGIFDCPNRECERPFNLAIFSEKNTVIASVGFYEREHPGTLKAKRVPSPTGEGD